MREAHLARPGADSASDDRGRGRGVVRGAEGRLVHDPAARSEEPGHRVDARHLESFLPRQGREDAGQASREHRLARSGRAREEEVVATGCGHLERTSGALLAAHVPEIWMRPPQERWTLDDRSRGEAPPEILPRLDKMMHGHGYDACKGCLPSRLHRADEAIQPGPASRLRGNEDTWNGTESPVQRELAHCRVLGEPLRRYLARRREHGERDR
jgi:hypothetical protein